MPFHCLDWPPSSFLPFHSRLTVAMRTHIHNTACVCSSVHAYSSDTHQRKVNEQTDRGASDLICKHCLTPLCLCCMPNTPRPVAKFEFTRPGLLCFKCLKVRFTRMNQLCLKNWNNAGSSGPLNSSFQFCLFVCLSFVQMCAHAQFHPTRSLLTHMLLYFHTALIHKLDSLWPSQPLLGAHTHTPLASCHCVALRSLEEVSGAGMQMGRMCSWYRCCCSRHALSTINHLSADAALTWILK